RFGLKSWMRRAWSAAPPNALINATLFTPPMRALARWIYFQKRGSGGAMPASELARRGEVVRLLQGGR
ncbi:MAG TPA: hypothetical protein P5072_16095, partial [Parvularculaceae bacterium]|nr:hypothetical protein [Parvularculaceae bacterium]